jgi:hypothetical protein
VGRRPLRGSSATAASTRQTRTRRRTSYPARRSRAGTSPAGRALDDDWPDVLAALRRGLKADKPSEASRAAVAYVQLVYGRQLQQPSDEAPTVDALDVASMTRDQRAALRARVLAEHPHLADELRGTG